MATQQQDEPEVIEVAIALAASDLAIGTNRIPFGLIEQGTGAVREGNVQVSTFYLGNGTQEGPIENLDAVFRTWPSVPGGVFVVSAHFDRAGNWGIGVTVSENGVVTKQGSLVVQVKEQSATPTVGAVVPRSNNKTVSDVERLSQLTTDTNPDSELYEMTILEALDTGKPLVVTFATPLYCQTATCGPQVDVVKKVKGQYGDVLNFIHVEVYDNPEEIEGDLSRARISPTLEEWGLPSEPWVFVVTADGKLSSKFEGFVGEEEIIAAIEALLAS
ncbi:MAG: hypothetical protein O2854_02500 [Chloroflexi bacterium]|nr:hypothetical protein [Chloroflexota bacterium]